MSYDVWTSYDELNAELKQWGATDAQLFDRNKHPNPPALIVGTRKWSYEGLSERGPEWPLQLGYDLAEHVKLRDKYDLFIYTQ